MTTTITRPWSPGEPFPRGTLVLEDSTQLLRGIEGRARTVWQQLQAKRRYMAGRPADDPYWPGLTGLCARDVDELRGLFTTRRSLRREIAAAKENLR